jgi:alcohol dehydrogenase (cytochrome c)
MAGKLLGTAERLLIMRRSIAFVLGVWLLVAIPLAQSRREITFDDIVRPKPGDWPSYNGSLTANRHSPLDQINTTNVSTLEQKWTLEMGGKRSLQMTPLVVDGVMYVAAVNEVRALDARDGRELWQFSRPQTPGLVPTGDPASGINRSIAVLGSRLFLQTDHAHLVALDRATGKVSWDVEMADYRQNYGATGALLVVNDLVIAGISAGDEGVRGFLDAYRASTGERVWRFWTVPARGEPGSETWIGKAIEHGCATTWLTGSYDPDARLVYWPTGNPCPDYNGEERKGDNLYSSSILALEPATGKLRWYFQFTPHDLHDWDANQPPMLVDADFRGQRRKLLAVANRNGFFYLLDRLTGKLLMAEPFVKNITWASGIGEDGRPKLLAEYENSVEGTQTCPSVSGAANWPSSAFSPATGLFYVMTSEACSVYRKNSDWFELGKSFYGGSTKNATIEGGGKSLRALDLQTGKPAWEIPDIGGGISASGVLSTAGGLVFYGDNNNGSFIAVDARSSKRLWQFDTQQVWKSSPMTYAVGGKQYVAAVPGSTVRVFGLPN